MFSLILSLIEAGFGLESDLEALFSSVFGLFMCLFVRQDRDDVEAHAAL